MSNRGGSSQAGVLKPMSNPYKVETVRCAGPGCANVRRETNHWFRIRMSPSGEHAAANFVCTPYAAVDELDEDDYPVCGQACAQKLFDQFLADAPCAARSVAP